MASRRLMEFTRDKAFLRGGTESYEVGDIVELSFDGVPRRIREVGPDHIIFTPAHDSLPRKAGSLCNWKTNESFELDLRLRDDSPGGQLSETGGPAGSTIDVRAFGRRDFDGDGERDLPFVPAEVTRE
jgi:hypothetical protein